MVDSDTIVDAAPPDRINVVLSADDGARAFCLLLDLAHGGEFAAFMQSQSTPEIPFAAMREYEEAEKFVVALLQKAGEVS